MSMPPPPPPPGYQGGYPMQAPPPPTHSKATTSLILGIVSIVMCGFFTGVPAIILGRQAKREIADSGGQLGGDGLATAGFVTGLIGTILSALATLLLVGLLVLGVAVSESFDESCTTFDEQGYAVSC